MNIAVLQEFATKLYCMSNTNGWYFSYFYASFIHLSHDYLKQNILLVGYSFHLKIVYIFMGLQLLITGYLCLSKSVICFSNVQV